MGLLINFRVYRPYRGFEKFIFNGSSGIVLRDIVRKQDKKYIDYIDREECFLSERQEGEEKAIMKNLRLKEVSIKDLDQIRALYWRLLDSSPKYGQILQWKKNIYPNDDDWNSYIVKGEMYLILKDMDVIGAVAVTNAQSKEYRKIHWKVKADDRDVAVVHLLMILPEYQGDGAATAALDEIIKLAADKKKKAVRLDAIGTNVPAQRFNKRSANKFDSNFKNNHLQAIMKQNNSLKVIFNGEI